MMSLTPQKMQYNHHLDCHIHDGNVYIYCRTDFMMHQLYNEHMKRNTAVLNVNHYIELQRTM